MDLHIFLVEEQILIERNIKMELRPYKSSDAETILSWCDNEKSFYEWSAGILGNYPITEKQFGFVESLIAFTAFENNEIVGFFTLRKPDGSVDELRIGFVIIDPEKRKMGLGKKMLELGLDYAFMTGNASTVSLGVFANNLSAYYCYRSAGFEDIETKRIETYEILGEKWVCKEMIKHIS